MLDFVRDPTNVTESTDTAAERLRTEKKFHRLQGLCSCVQPDLFAIFMCPQNEITLYSTF